MRLSTIWLVKNDVIIASRREMIRCSCTICEATEGTVNSWRAKYLIEVSASLSTRRYASITQWYTIAKCRATQPLACIRNSR